MKISLVEIFVFIFVFIVLILLFVLYDVIKPNIFGQKYNIVPLPSIFPDNVPDTDITTKTKCQDILIKCDPSIGCVNCNDDFECINVPDNSNIYFNGNKVGKGSWCLPKGNKTCGLYTGRSVWSNKEGQQQWSCICLYPDLFGGDDCNQQLACKDPSKDADSDQSKNVLKSADGTIWDPNSKDFNPNGKTPYDKDENGNPLFTCSCDQGSDKPGSLLYTRLPNDPYRCHLEPCSVDHKSRGFNEKTGQCDCSYDTTNSLVHSNTTGKCYPNSCGAGGIWDPINNTCKCGNGYINNECSSDLFYRKDKPLCDDPQNASGSTCINPCSPNPCKNNGQCLPTGDSKLYKCVCPTGFKGNNCEITCKPKGYSQWDYPINDCCGAEDSNSECSPSGICHTVYTCK